MAATRGLGMTSADMVRCLSMVYEGQEVVVVLCVARPRSSCRSFLPLAPNLSSSLSSPIRLYTHRSRLLGWCSSTWSTRSRRGAAQKGRGCLGGLVGSRFSRAATATSAERRNDRSSRDGPPTRAQHTSTPTTTQHRKVAIPVPDNCSWDHFLGQVRDRGTEGQEGGGSIACVAKHEQPEAFPDPWPTAPQRIR